MAEIYLLRLTNRIKKLRKSYSYTQEQLSELSGIDYKHIQKLESKNPIDPKLSTLMKIAKAFKISISEFLNF